MRRALFTAAAVATAFVGLAGCGSSKPTTTAPPPPQDLRGQKAVEIDAKSDQFSPSSIIVDVGTKVTWHNADPVAHNVMKSADTVDFGAPFGADAVAFGPGRSYSFTFIKPGTYFYTCTIHALMSGEVDVRAKP